MTRVIGLGAGGHAEILLEILCARPDFEVVAFLTPDEKRHGESYCGYPIAGGDELISRFISEGTDHAFNGVGGFGSKTAHRIAFDRARDAGLKFVTVVHPSAVISPSAKIGEGSVILAQAVVNTGAELGRNVIVNTAATVDHHCVIGDHVHLAPGVHLAGGVTVGEDAQIGIGAVVREGVQIGRGAIVGAGTVVLKNIPAGSRVVGVPARIL